MTDEIAKARDVTMPTVAIMWLMCEPTVVGSIGSVRLTKQVDALLAAKTFEFSANELDLRDEKHARVPAQPPTDSQSPNGRAAKRSGAARERRRLRRHCSNEGQRVCASAPGGATLFFSTTVAVSVVNAEAVVPAESSRSCPNARALSASMSWRAPLLVWCLQQRTSSRHRRGW